MELSWGKLKVPWNSMEFHGTQEYGKKSSMEFHGTLDLNKIPWNSMELEVLLLKFHGIPWNDRYCSVRHGTWIPWNSMELGVRQYRWHEQFHGIPLEVRQFRWHEQFHGIPWNSMELCVLQFRWHGHFHWIPWNIVLRHFRWLEHGTARVIEIGALQVPWNSMEFHGSARNHNWKILISK